MADKSREKPKRWVERKGESLVQRGKPRQARPQASRTKAKNRERRSTSEELLRSDAGHEVEAYIEQNRKRPKFPD
jgi:hypothetical protein